MIPSAKAIWSRRFQWLGPIVLSGIVLLRCTTAPALPEYEGAFPVDQPKYDGVEQVLVLSDRWIIVVLTEMDTLLTEIDTLSHGQLQRATDTWINSKTSGDPDWVAFKLADKIRDTYIAQARENIGERELGKADLYQISSADDERYTEAKHPRQVARMLVGLGEARVPGAPPVDYVTYAYLAFPEPMKSGKTYTIRVRDNATVMFRFDENHTVSRAIKVNQVGYLPDASEKFAYLGAHLYDAGPLDCSMYPTFEVVDAKSGAVAFSGPLKLRDKNSRSPGKSADGTSPLLYGEDLYEMDFTALTATGTFFIRIPGVGRSWPFHHSPDAYGEAFYTAMRGFYHQRCGIAMATPFTAWTRPECHTDPVYECEHIEFPMGLMAPKDYNRFDIIGATLDKSKATPNVRGGWHDAADWDRRSPHYTAIFDLLYAYEIAPHTFADGQLNLPESGNGIPDILDEALYGLAVWTQSMTESGGVAGHVETWTHPAIDGDVDYAFSRRTRWDSLLYAAAAAQLSQLLQPFAPTISTTLTSKARMAYDFGSNPANSLGNATFHARRNRGTGEAYTVEWGEKDEPLIPFLIHAKARLYRLTGDKTYLDTMSQLLDAPIQPYRSPYSYLDYSPWVYFSLLYGPDSFIPAFQRKALVKKYFLDPADVLCDEMEAMPYRHSWPREKVRGLSWGTSDMCNPGRALFIAYALTGNPKYRNAALQNMDFMLGANPMGMSWTTGLGFVYPTEIQHEISQKDGVADPVPGITVYGITEGSYPTLRNQVWSSPGGSMSKDPVAFLAPQIPLWRRWSCHPSLNAGQCEFTIHETMASTAFCMAMALPDGWKPGARLKERKPREKAELHGHWYLP